MKFAVGGIAAKFRLSPGVSLGLTVMRSMPLALAQIPFLGSRLMLHVLHLSGVDAGLRSADELEQHFHSSAADLKRFHPGPAV